MSIPRHRRWRATLAFAVPVVCLLLLMPTFLSLLFAATPDPAYPRLSDPRLPERSAGAGPLEVRKVMDGPVDAMFALPGRQQVIVVAGHYLWRFDAHGQLLETLKEPAWLHMSGVAFGPDGYVDWMLTGDPATKPYGPAVPGDGLSRQALDAMLDTAQVVAFGRDAGNAWAWLWRDGQAWKVDIGRWRDQVDTSCRPSDPARTWEWSSTCLEGYAGRPSLLRLVETESFAGGYGDYPSRLDVAGFDRRHYHLEDGVSGQVLGATVGQVLKHVWDVPGANPARYWFGDAHVRLHVGGETVQFKAFVPRVGDEYDFLHTMRWREPARAMPGASPWFSVHMRGYMERSGELDLLRHYGPDIGLYVVRPRQPAAAGDAPAWRPRFEGPQTRYDAVTAQVETDGGAAVHRWLRPMPPRPQIGAAPSLVVDAVQPDLHALPVAMTVEWGRASDPEAYSRLHVVLPPQATAEAFARLRAAAPLELVLRAPDLHGAARDMQLVLRGKGSEAVIEGAQVAWRDKPAFRPRAPGQPTRHAQLDASIEAAAQGDAEAREDFLRQAAALAAEPERVGIFAAAVTAGYARLVNACNLAGDAACSSRLVRHYLDRVHAATAVHDDDASVPYNVGVIASQALAFAVHLPKERDLVDAVMATLIGPDFDPQRQTNATLMYNLACHYALRGEVDPLLESAAAARRLGKPAAQFLADADFGPYLHDPAFLAAIGVEGGAGGASQ